MKYPTKKQRILLKRNGLNPRKWIVTENNRAVSRHSGIICILKKEGVNFE